MTEDKYKTEKQLLEELSKLRKSEQFFRNIALCSGDWLWEFDRDCVYTHAAGSKANILGYSDEEIVGKTPFDLMPDDEAERVRAIFVSLMRKKKPIVDLENMNLTKKGKKVHILTNGLPMLDDNGKLLGYSGVDKDITAIKGTAEQIDSGEKKLEALIEATGTGYAILDIKGNVIEANSEYTRLSGFTNAEDIKGKNISHWTAGSDQEKTQKAIQEVISKGVVRNHEVDHILNNGTIIPVEVNAALIETSKGKQIVALLRDITGRRKMEDELRESDKKFREFVENLPQTVFEIDNEGIITFVNKNVYALFGYTENDLKNKISIFQLIHHDYHAKIEKKIVQIQKGQIVKSIEIIAQRSDGSPFPVLAFPSLIIKNNKIAGIRGIIADISERKEIKKELAEQQKFLGYLINSMPGIFYAFGRDGRFLYWNENFEKITGYSRQEFQSMQMLDFFSGISKQNIAEGMEDAFSKGYATREEVVTTKVGRQIPFFLNGKLVVFQNREYLIGLGIDISDRKILEGQLRQAQKMEAVGTLAGGVAHDFNNLLSVINGHSELALMKIDDTHSLYKDISSIKTAGDKAVNLTRQLLAFSRKQVYKSEALDINRVIADLTKMLRRLIEEDISVQMELIPDPPIIMADPGQIEQILINLVVNAKDAINTKTDKASEKKITIETKKMYVGGEYIDQHQGITEGHYLMFAVSDTGIGMDEDTKQKIFEPFFTTKGIGKGTGLGLATVYGIVKQNEGSIYAYSEPGKGTTFKIYWPATEAKAENNSKEQISTEAISGFGETILIVEDDEGVRNYTVTVLKSFKYRVYSAKNGSAALKLIDKEQIKPDLLITDLIMPEMNGKELAEKFSKIFPEAGVIFMSGYTDNHIVHQGALKNDVHFIQKPYATDEFVQTVRQVLNHEVDK